MSAGRACDRELKFAYANQLGELTVTLTGIHMAQNAEFQTGLTAAIRTAICRSFQGGDPLWLPPPWLTFPLRLASETLCGRPSLPQRDPISDAECAGVLYRFRTQTLGTDGSSFISNAVDRVAPIVLVQEYFNPTGLARFYRASLRPMGATDDTQDSSLLPNGAVSANGLNFQTFIIEATPLESTENCEIPPPPPDEPPTIAPPTTVNIGPFTITLGDFNQDVTVEGDITFWQPQLDVNLDVAIPISVNIAPNLLFPGGTRFPALFQIGPNTLNTAIGFNPEFRIGRLNLNIGGTFNEGDGGESLTSDEVEDVIRENIATKALKPQSPLVILGTIPLGDSGVQILPERARELRIISTRSLLETRREFGGENAPEVNYLGWASFGGESGGFGERVPISYESSSYPIPLGSLSCLFTLTRGSSGRAEIWGDEG